MKKLNRRDVLRAGNCSLVHSLISRSYGVIQLIMQTLTTINSFSSPSISEYTPPKMPKLTSLKARLHWNENPFGPSEKALNSYFKSGNYYSWDL